MKTLTATLTLLASFSLLPAAFSDAPIEAPAGFDNLTNGHLTQAEFDVVRATFDEQEHVEDGLGPVYNAQSCGECHQTTVSGALSQVTVMRAGSFDGTTFRDHPGGSLIHDRAIDAALQERVQLSANVVALRTSLNTLGDGYVEAIADATLEALAAAQPPAVRGQVIRVPVIEAGGALRVARFGWKNQHASLVSFAADAYLNEMGITSPLLPEENTSNGRPVAAFDSVPDPEDSGKDIEAFADFMRATKAPPRDLVLAATPDASAGRMLFGSLGCAQCHTPEIVTAPAGTLVNGGQFVVTAALGNKLIHPYGDFLLHDVGTGDGIVQNGGPGTRNKLRTPPLWGLRTRSRLMHDGLSPTRHDAILRHAGQAAASSQAYRALNPTERRQLLTFLDSL
jgi:CxxC motif-containing protein (DUF1111 family)